VKYKPAETLLEDPLNTREKVLLIPELNPSLPLSEELMVNPL
jgi:hypothetical protein